MPLTAVRADVFSNARIKTYPLSKVLQVVNEPIFHADGWEQERAYDVSPKGDGSDPERAAESSRARARRSVRDIVLCNSFDHFFTWTLDGSRIDRYDADVIKVKLSDFLKNAVRRKNFAYVLIPEFHKDGAIHFHGLCKMGDFRLERASDPHTGKELCSASGRPIYNMPEWKLGFSTCIPLDENYERTCNYIVKYITKDSQKIFGKWYLSSRNLVKRPEIELVDGGIDYYTFAEEHSECSPISLYKDVKMISCSFPYAGGCSV